MSDSEVKRFRLGDSLTPNDGFTNAVGLVHMALAGESAQVADKAVELAAPMTLRAAVELAAATTQMAAQGLGIGATEVLNRVRDPVLRCLEAPGPIDLRDRAARRGDALLSQAGGASLPRTEGPRRRR